MTGDARRPSFGSGWIGLRFSRIRGGRPRGPRAGEEKWAWLFITPMLLGLVFLSAAPIVATFAVSLTHWDLLTPPDPAGLENYTRLLSDQRFLIALRDWRIQEKLVAHVEIASNRRTCGIAKRHNPLLPSLPRHTH